MISAKKGDRVRATCGESVIVGLVTQSNLGGVGVSVKIPESAGAYWYWLPVAWSIEVIAPPVPDVVGTIVRDIEDDAWQRHADGWHATKADYDVYDLRYLHEDYGPLTVVWEPTP